MSRPKGSRHQARAAILRHLFQHEEGLRFREIRNPYSDKSRTRNQELSLRTGLQRLVANRRVETSGAERELVYRLTAFARWEWERSYESQSRRDGTHAPMRDL
jgi:hypothetical protein